MGFKDVRWEIANRVRGSSGSATGVADFAVVTDDDHRNLHQDDLGLSMTLLWFFMVLARAGLSRRAPASWREWFFRRTGASLPLRAAGVCACDSHFRSPGCVPSPAGAGLGPRARWLVFGASPPRRQVSGTQKERWRLLMGDALGPPY